MNLQFRTILLSASLLTSMTGCFTVSKAQYQGLTSGMIGCPASEITISNDQLGQVTTWEADCRGRHYFCSGAGQAMSCKEAMQAPATAQQQP